MASSLEILSRRFFENRYFYQIVYEWEEDISKFLNLKLDYPSSLLLHRLKRFNLNTKKYKLLFDMYPDVVKKKKFFKPKNNHIHWIIDFYPVEKTVEIFDQNYKDSKIVFISSRQVYEYLKSQKISSNIQHLALSLSNRWMINNPKDFFKKKYDIVLAGRQNNKLTEFLNRYSLENPELKLLNSKKINGQYFFIDKEGNNLGSADSRENYFNLLKESKVFLYSTPGLDMIEGPTTNGFNQVTPRFLEALAAGCNLIMRYAENEDTKFYELEKFGPSVSLYEEFKLLMEYGLSNAPDWNLYKSYLRKHSTSHRAEELQHLLDDLKL